MFKTYDTDWNRNGQGKDGTLRTLLCIVFAGQ